MTTLSARVDFPPTLVAAPAARRLVIALQHDAATGLPQCRGRFVVASAAGFG